MGNMEVRANAVAEAGGFKEALNAGTLAENHDISVSEALVLGLLNQGVRKYVGIFGHGSTQIGDVLRIYEKAGVVRVFNVRHETEASHIASAMRWQYGESIAVFTSIGPGALQALAGSLVGASNGLGIYYIFGEETTRDEGYNMQQIPRPEQGLFLKMMSHMGPSYMLHTPEALSSALKKGISTIYHPHRPSPFFLLLPMNVQPAVMEDYNLRELPDRSHYSLPHADGESVEKACEMIRRHKKICIKIGRGALDVDASVLKAFMEKAGAVLVHGPSSVGVLPSSDPLNMGVGGSKGSVSGNYAMEEAELLILIGARAVCQWDSSGTAWKSARQIININTDIGDALHYNRTLPLIGDAEKVLNQLLDRLEGNEISDEWLDGCRKARDEWERFKNARFERPVIADPKWERPLLTQPAAIHEVAEFAGERGFEKIFDAGDVQANGFQVVMDDEPGMTFTETGASYMGYAASALVAGGLAERGRYSIAFTGDGSFMMNPQVLIDGVEHGAKGMIALFDNRRMAAISSLQVAQYGEDFRTDDSVEVDFIAMAESVKGVKAFHGGYSVDELREALKRAADYDGLSLLYVPVYFGDDELGGLGAFGNWNVGNWCEDVQKTKQRLGF